MNHFYRTCLPLIVAAFLLFPVADVSADSGQSTRIDQTKQDDAADRKRTSCRKKSDYILRELDLKPGDVVGLLVILARDGVLVEALPAAGCHRFELKAFDRSERM